LKIIYSINLIKFDSLEIEEAPDWPSGQSPHGVINGGNAMKLSKKFLHWGPLSALCLIFTIGLSTTLVHARWWPITTFFGCLDLIIFLSWNYLVLKNMILSSKIGGGYVSLGWMPHKKEFESRLQFCKKCNGYKVPRSHHCSKCDRCVLKMDHHCPWINNCVGHRNQVCFIKFLFFAVIGSIHSAIVLTICLSNTIIPGFLHSYLRISIGRRINSLSLLIFAILGVGFAYGVILAVGILLIVQLKSVKANKTAIEDYICKKAEYRTQPEPFIFPYNLGIQRNIAEVFFHLTSRNGIWWPILKGTTQFSFTEEQLAQKAVKSEQARIIRVVINFSGGFFSSLFIGIRLFCSQPWTSEPRLPIREGEIYLVTRINRRWLYGYKLNETSTLESDDDTHSVTLDSGSNTLIDGKIPLRGWFPKECVLALK